MASVLRANGYIARVTAYSRDGGIDIVLDGPDDEVVGVQVKRWKNSIKVNQIDALAGAIVLRRMDAGIFVTTSRFQSGCNDYTKKFASLGYPIELINGRRFFEALKIVQRDFYDSENELKERGSQHLIKIETLRTGMYEKGVERSE